MKTQPISQPCSNCFQVGSRDEMHRIGQCSWASFWLCGPCASKLEGAIGPLHAQTATAI